MGLVYSRRLGEATQTGAGTASVYTVPAGVTAVVRDIAVLCESAGSFVALLSRIGGVPIWFGSSAAANTYLHEEGRKVLYAGDQLEFTVNGGTWTVNISGYELT